MELGHDAAGPGPDDGSRLGNVVHAAARGTVGAMAMTGMRVITTELGLVEQTPPQAIARQRARGARALLRRLALAADHLLFGLVLSEGRRRARD